MNVSTFGRRALLVGITGLMAKLASAQTRIRGPLQIRGEAVPGGSLLGFTSTGDARQVAMSPRLSLSFTSNPGVLDTVAQQSPTRITGEAPTQSTTAPLQYTLGQPPRANSEAVYRNGIRQQRGPDYSITGAVVTFVTVYAPDPTAPVMVDYEV